MHRRPRKQECVTCAINTRIITKTEFAQQRQTNKLTKNPVESYPRDVNPRWLENKNNRNPPPQPVELLKINKIIPTSILTKIPIKPDKISLIALTAQKTNRSPIMQILTVNRTVINNPIATQLGKKKRDDNVRVV